MELLLSFCGAPGASTVGDELHRTTVATYVPRIVDARDHGHRPIGEMTNAFD
jgi:hypothetical protein